MKQISLTALQITHFRSFVQPTVIDLTTNSGLKLITSDNQVEPRLGANGCGKSTLWDAVCFALYGTSVKGLRAADLVSHGQQTVAVVVFFTVNGKPHSIHRTAPPMRIFLDNGDGARPVEQADVDQIIGLSKARFLNSVVFGQATPLFLDLPTPARGDLLDEVLDLELWMRAADKAGVKYREADKELSDLLQAIAMTTGRLDGIGDLERFREQIDAWEQRKQERLNVVLGEFEELEMACAKLDLELADCMLNPVDETETKERYEHMREQNTEARARLAKIETEMKVLLQDTQFLAENDICPTCNQPITDAHRLDYHDRVLPRLEELDNNRRVAALDIETTGAELPACETTWRGTVRKNHEIRSTKMLLERQIADKQRMMDRLEKEAERLSQEANPHVAEAERVAQEYQRLETRLEQQRGAESETVGRLASLDFWRQGFRKVRLYCLDTVLQELAAETHNSLLTLGLSGWGVDFTTATETKSGTLRLGVQVDIRAPEATRKFEMMSGGEGQRTRLAVSLGLANLIQRWAGVRFDLEVFDEPTAFLSEQGIEDLLESLRVRAETNNRSIWVCDHRALLYSGFSEVMNIVKTTEGSRIQ